MNYHNGFPCTEEIQNSGFIDHSCQSSWNTPPNLPPTWEPTSYVNPTVSIISGLFHAFCYISSNIIFWGCCLHILRFLFFKVWGIVTFTFQNLDGFNFSFDCNFGTFNKTRSGFHSFIVQYIFKYSFSLCMWWNE